ncbi:MAG: SLBB domain-containing protein [Steroidobacteraceae bacterium]
MLFRRSNWLPSCCMMVLALASLTQGHQAVAAAQQPLPAAAAKPADAQQPAAAVRRLPQLGPGDSVSLQVFGQPDMTSTLDVAEDGTIAVPLVGNVQVNGLTPAAAARATEKALADGKYLIDPHVTITITQSRNQKVSVLGEVGTPGRYPIDSNTTIFDLLALAGGARETSSDVVFLLRPDADGKINRYPISLKGLGDGTSAMPTQSLQGGDSIFVPRAPQFYIFGEVAQPNMYRIEPGMTIVQAIARAGGVTVRGSRNRFEVKRKDPNGVEHVVKSKLSDLVQPNDVIRVKESIF